MEAPKLNKAINDYFDKHYAIVDGIIQVPSNYSYNTIDFINLEVSEMFGIPLMSHFNAWAESKLGDVIEIQFLDKKIIFYNGIEQRPYIEVSAEEFKRMFDIIGVRL